MMLKKFMSQIRMVFLEIVFGFLLLVLVIVIFIFLVFVGCFECVLCCDDFIYYIFGNVEGDRCGGWYFFLGW